MNGIILSDVDPCDHHREYCEEEGMAHGTFLGDFHLAVQAASMAFEDAESAKRWLTSEPIACLGNMTGVALIEDGRLGDLLDYLRSIESGFVG